MILDIVKPCRSGIPSHNGEGKNQPVQARSPSCEWLDSGDNTCHFALLLPCQIGPRGESIAMKQPITVLVPCKNEEHNLQACLESAGSLANEILITDSGSTDRTLEIAARFREGQDYSAITSPRGIAKTGRFPGQQPIDLLLDADERATPELCEEIRLALSRGPEFDGYWIYEPTVSWAIDCVLATRERIESFACLPATVRATRGRAITGRSNIPAVASVA